MNKQLKLILAVVLVVALSLTLFACGGQNDSQGEMTLVVLDGDNTKEYSVDLAKLPSGDAKSGLMAVLAYLEENDDLTYTAQSSAYGQYLTQVNGIEAGAGAYICLYTDVESDIDVSVYAMSVTYKGKEYTNSNVGASLMSVKAGCTVIIAKGTY